jgi:hypothetical protein
MLGGRFFAYSCLPPSKPKTFKESIMPNYYGTPTTKELHQKSIEESARKADRVQKFFANHQHLDPKDTEQMDRAQENYNLAYPGLEETIAKGYVDDQESKSYAYTSQEAAALISGGAEKIMKQDKCSYLEAANKFCENPKNKEIVRCYAKAD